MQMPFSIRHLSEADIPAVAQIEREAFPTFCPATSFKREMQNKRISYLVVSSAIPADGPDLSVPQPAGVAASAPRGPLPLRLIHSFKGLLKQPRPVESPPRDTPLGFVSIWFLTDEAHITAIAVREAWRGQGLGEILLIGAFEASFQRKSRVMTLEVRVSNSPAIALYEKYGFKRVGIRKGYYTDNREDAAIMTTEPLQAAIFRERFEELRKVCFERHGAVDISFTPQPH
ncbi:MAG: ribosomal-protein-alanine N-acetyltransferase [SAR202 cluster bacterium]|nr:ribosomal-protein-alanine N-acetyltransferase [SAR202 cluster bacterium]